MADSKEAQFQQDIIDALAAQGWQNHPFNMNTFALSDLTHG